MGGVFKDKSTFNNISSWDVSSVTDMSYMFSGASLFNGYLSDWCVKNVQRKPNRLDDNSILSQEDQYGEHAHTSEFIQI